MRSMKFALFGASGILALAGAASGAHAQATPDSPADATQEVVVTGSRIRQPAEFASPDPIQVITSEQSSLRGFINTSQIIQQSTVAGNGSQINNFFTGYVVNGGPGVNTVSLRGLGTDRTLVLIDGQRVGPAGTQGAVGSVDLNTIPSTIIDHIDILKDGSSSIYGSDAVAGVVNIVTKKNLDGGDLHIYAKPFTTGGNEYDASASFGKTWDRGFFNVSGDYYRQDALRDYQRSYLSCTQDFAHNPTTGASMDLIDPTTGQAKCFNQLSQSIEDANTGRLYIPAGNATPGLPTNNNFPSIGLARAGCTVRDTPAGAMCSTNTAYPVDVALTRATHAEEPYADSETLNTTAISPVVRYTATASMGFDIIPNRVQVYNDFLFNRRISSQTSWRQIFPDVQPGNPSNPFNNVNGDYLLPIVLTPFGAQQKVDYIRDIGGFRGDLPNIWTANHIHYDLSAQFSQSKGTYKDDIIQLDRVNATSAATACDPSSGASDPGNFNGGPSMNDLGDKATCVPVNWLADSFNGGFSPAEKAFLTATDVGRTTYEQAYVQGDVTANLFNLPAGPLGTDLGFHVRRDRINDVPGQYTLEGNSYGLSGAGITRGAQDVQELFAEFSIPVLKDFPFIKALSFDISGRYSHYDTVGDAKTYKASMNWRITDWLAIKYVQGTSFRAPQLYELFLANQTGFLDQFGLDPCINYGQGASANVAKNCASQGIPADYAGNGPSALEVAGGAGKGNILPETSLSKTVGIVFTPHWFGLNAGLEVDYYENHISNGIQQFGASNILSSCYNSNTFPTNGFCSLFQRDLNPSSPTYLSILQVNNNYVNVASVLDRGLDATFFFSQKLPYDVHFRFDSQLSWTFQESTQLPGATSVDYNGTVGSPNFVGNMNFKFDWHTWTVNWFVNMIGKTSDARLTSDLIPSFRGTGVPASVLIHTPFYATHNLSFQKKIGTDITLTAGILNVFDEPPPAYSDEGVEGLLGQVPLASQYDLVGRTGFVQLDKKF